MLNYLSGTPEDLGRAKKKKKSERKEERKEKKQERKETRKRKVAKIAVAPARATFLLAIQANFLKLAKRLAKAYKADRSRVEAWWVKLGGDVNALKKAIEKGSKEQLGVVTAAAAATAFVTAAPIIVAATKLLKEMRMNEPGDETEDGNFLRIAQNELALDPNVPKGTADMKGDAGLVKGDEEGGASKYILPVGLGLGAFALYKMAN